MQSKEFFDFDQAESYLNNSLIRYKGEPLFVRRVFDEDFNRFFIRGDRSVDGEPVTVPTTSKDVDYTPMELGFFNYTKIGIPGIVIACYRRPIRGWKVGLSSCNVSWSYHADENCNSLGPNFGGDDYNIIPSKPLRDSIMGEFPSFQQCLDDLSSESKFSPTSRAWCKEFSVNNIGQLHTPIIKWEPVGSVSMDNGDIHLDKRYEFLDELVKERKTA